MELSIFTKMALPSRSNAFQATGFRKIQVFLNDMRGLVFRFHARILLISGTELGASGHIFSKIFFFSKLNLRHIILARHLQFGTQRGPNLAK